MSHETLRLKPGNDPWRRLPDTAATESYLKKLSHAATVLVLLDSGEAWAKDGKWEYDRIGSIRPAGKIYRYGTAWLVMQTARFELRHLRPLNTREKG